MVSTRPLFTALSLLSFVASTAAAPQLLPLITSALTGLLFPGQASDPGTSTTPTYQILSVASGNVGQAEPAPGQTSFAAMVGVTFATSYDDPQFACGQNFGSYQKRNTGTQRRSRTRLFRSPIWGGRIQRRQYSTLEASSAIACNDDSFQMAVVQINPPTAAVPEGWYLQFQEDGLEPAYWAPQGFTTLEDGVSVYMGSNLTSSVPPASFAQ